MTLDALTGRVEHDVRDAAGVVDEAVQTYFLALVN